MDALAVNPPARNAFPLLRQGVSRRGPARRDDRYPLIAGTCNARPAPGQRQARRRGQAPIQLLLSRGWAGKYATSGGTFVKIKSIRAFTITNPIAGGAYEAGMDKAEARRPPWTKDAEVANPMSRYPRYKRMRSSWNNHITQVCCIVFADDSTKG